LRSKKCWKTLILAFTAQQLLVSKLLLLCGVFGQIGWTSKWRAFINDLWYYYILADGLRANNIGESALLFGGCGCCMF
jgi:hypothetical protein